MNPFLKYQNNIGTELALRYQKLLAQKIQKKKTFIRKKSHKGLDPIFKA